MSVIAAPPIATQMFGSGLIGLREGLETGIVVMKGYGAGMLLKQPGMTPEKAIHYGLTRPGVVTPNWRRTWLPRMKSPGATMVCSSKRVPSGTTNDFLSKGKLAHPALRRAGTR